MEWALSPAKAMKSVGVIGLGIMGGSFTRNLIKAGWRVIGFDVDPKKQKELTKAGAWIVRSAKEVAATCPIIITSLPKPEALMATAKEIAGAGLPPRIIAECSTFTIEDKEKAEKMLRKAGHTMLDLAPCCRRHKIFWVRSPEIPAHSQLAGKYRIKDPKAGLLVT